MKYTCNDCRFLEVIDIGYDYYNIGCWSLHKGRLLNNNLFPVGINDIHTVTDRPECYYFKPKRGKE